MLEEIVNVLDWIQHKDGSRLKEAEEYVQKVGVVICHSVIVV